MIKKVLFLYFNSQGKNTFAECEKVFRAILRKFRVSPLFNSMQIDVSPSCRSFIKETLSKEAPKYDAIFLFSEKDSKSEEEIFFREILEVSVSELHTGRKAIVFPASDFTVEEKDERISESFIFLPENLNKAVERAFSLAGKRKHKITITLPDAKRASSPLMHRFEEFSAKAPHIDTECISLGEMIFLCINTFPEFDVILTTSLIAEIIVSHIDASKTLSQGYIVHHTDSGHIYSRKTSPYEEYNNSAFLSNIMAFSALLEDVGMKNASDWLRRCIAIASEQAVSASHDILADRIITEIKKPIRIKRYTQ